MPKLGIKEHEIVKISKKRGTFSGARFCIKSQVGENEALFWLKGPKRFVILRIFKQVFCPMPTFWKQFPSAHLLLFWIVVVIFNIKVLMNEFSAFIVSLSFYFIHCLYIMKSNHVLNMQVHKSTLHLCPRDSYDVVCKRLLVESVTMAGNAKIWPKIQTMTEAAIFTIGRSRTIGYGKIRPLADYWSRSRLLNFENIFYLRKWNMK